MTRLAGDRAPDTKAMIRVDQAGEYGAKRIYAGQLAVMGNRHASSGEIARMAAQEDVHLAAFDRLVTHLLALGARTAYEGAE